MNTNINTYRKSIYNIETYLDSLFGQNYDDIITNIVNLIYNPITKFTLHIWYNKLNGSSGKSTFIKYLETLYINTFYEIPISYIKNIDIFMENINNIKNKKNIYVNNIEFDDININILNYLKNININLIIITNNETKNNIKNNIDNYDFNNNFIEFPHIFVNRRVTHLENINIRKSSIDLLEKLNNIQEETMYYLNIFYRKNNNMIPSKKRKMNN